MDSIEFAAAGQGLIGVPPKGLIGDFFLQHFGNYAAFAFLILKVLCQLLEKRLVCKIMMKFSKVMSRPISRAKM